MARNTIKTGSKPAPIEMVADVQLMAAEVDGEGKPKGPPTFDVVAYTGGAMNIQGYEYPVVVDLDGITFGNSLVANLDHDRTKRVGNVTATAIKNGQLQLSGVASAATPYRDEVVNSAASGFVWQASIEANPLELAELAAGSSTEVNGQTIEGPAYIARQSRLKGFAFVSHGADDNTTVTIAAEAAQPKGTITMEPKVKAWAEKMLPGVDIDALPQDAKDGLIANYKGSQATPKKIAASANPFEQQKSEAKRREEIRSIADGFIERRGVFATVEDIEAIEKLHDHAIQAGMDSQAFRLEMYETMNIPAGHSVPRPRHDRSLTNRVLEAAVCEAGRLPDIEKQYSDQELQMARDRFPHGISLGELMIIAAEANGHRNSGGKVSIETQRAAFGMNAGRPIHAAGFSTLSIATIVSNTANKFLRMGWMAVDQTALRISAVRPVSDFKTITTVSLLGDVQYAKVGTSGEIEHGQLSELTYTNKADTYARMLAITRTDIINDDLGALTQTPRVLGRGAMLKLNDIFWTEFLSLVSAGFFASGNANINTGVATMSTGGLTATDTIFMDQTDPYGKPLGIMPAIILVPTALKTAANQLMTSEKIKGDSDEPDGNVWRGRFRVESSPYISNSSYTGYTSAGWWLLADPAELPVIEIAALNGRVEPTVESADADFNTLGIQMRGYSDVGVKRQEYRGGVYADGGSS